MLPEKDIQISTKDEAKELILSIIEYSLIVRCEKQDKFLLYHPSQIFNDDSFYVWLYTGSQLKTYLFGFAVIGGVFAGVLFPLWPASLRTGVYYLSLACLGLLGLLMIIAVIRLILWIITILTLKRGFWLFPNLFADVGIIESFIPFYGWETDEQYNKAVDSVNQKSKDD
jgi:translocation protein SEC62